CCLRAIRCRVSGFYMALLPCCGPRPSICRNCCARHPIRKLRIGGNCIETVPPENAGERVMTPETAAPSPQPARSVAAVSGPAVEKSRVRRSEKFPVAFHYTISIPMAESLRRLTTGPAALLREVDIGRLALHSYLLTNDPMYARAISNGGRNA